MRLVIAVFLAAILGVLGYLIWHETDKIDNLTLIEHTTEITGSALFDSKGFVLPAPTKITNKDKTISEFFLAKDVQEAFLNAKKDNVFYRGHGKEIYAFLAPAFVLVLFFGLGIGGIFGYWLRYPIDKYDFKALEEKTERELGVAWEETRKAHETAKNAQLEAMKQANADVENELRRAEYQRSEAEKERRAAIQAQNIANEATANAQRCERSRIAAIKIAEKRQFQILKQKEIVKMLKEKLEALGH
jgi:hypothetical protein